MPYISRVELKGLLPSVDSAIVDEAQFDLINNIVSGFISDHTGIEIPESANEAPQWIKLPACQIFYRMSVMQDQHPTSETVEDSQISFTAALKILDKHIVKKSVLGFKSVNIEERHKW